MVNSYNFDYQYFDDLEFVLFFVIAPACVFIYKKNVVSLQRKLVAYGTSNKQQAEETLIKNLFYMKHRFTLLFALLCASMMTWAAEPTTGSSTENMAGQGNPFTNGYDYSFSSEGTHVTISFTEKEGYVGLEAYLWDYTTGGMVETKMTVSGSTATITLTEQTPGATIRFACKFAYSGGGMSVTKEFTYTIPESEGGGEGTDPDPTPEPGVIDWNTVNWLGADTDLAEYTDKYKAVVTPDLAGTGINNLQPNGGHKCIHIAFPSAVFGAISLGNTQYHIEGAGMFVHLDAFTYKQTEFTIENNGTTYTFTVYYADGQEGSAVMVPEIYDVNFALASNGATATASSGNADFAIDGNENTRWESAATNDETYTLDMGQLRVFNTVKIKWEGAFCSQFELTYSTDGVTYQPLYTETALDAAGWQEIYFETPVTAQYIKYHGTKRATGYGQSFWEFEVLLQEGAPMTNIAVGKSIYASSAGANDVNRVVDGNGGTEWQGSVTNGTTNDEAARTYDAWFVVDLGAYYDIAKVSIVFEGACSQAYHVDFSADANTWKQVFEHNGNAGVNGHTKDIKFTVDNKKVRYVRFWSTKAATEWGMKIFEFQVFGTPVAVEVESIALDPSEATIEIGESKTLVPLFTPAYAIGQTVSWSSNKESIVSVTDGVIVGNAEGEAVITATSANGKTATCNITVEPISEKTWWGLTTIAEWDNMPVMYSITRNIDRTLTYTVYFGGDASGMVMQINNGAWNTLTGYTDSERKASFTTTTTYESGTQIKQDHFFYFGGPRIELANEYVVGASNEKPSTAVESVVISHSTASLMKDETIQLVASVVPAYADDKTLIWSSEDTNIATVANGVVTANAIGTTTITATSANGKTATCNVTVEALTEKTCWGVGNNFEYKETEVSYHYAFTRNADKTLTITAEFSHDITGIGNLNIVWNDIYHLMAYNATTKTATYTTVAGDTYETDAILPDAFFYFEGRRTDVTYIVGSVCDKPIVDVTGVEISNETKKLLTGETFTITANVIPANADNKNIIWSNSNPSVASIDEASGLVTALTTGTTIITATSQFDANLYATCEVTVVGALEPATWYGTAVFKVKGNPVAVNYSITRTSDRTLTYRTVLSETVTGMSMQLNDGEYRLMTQDETVRIAEWTSTNTYEDGATHSMFFYPAFEGGADRWDVDYVVGSSNEKPNTLVAFGDQADNTAKIAEYADEVVDAYINRTITAINEWFTLCLPFDMNEDKVFEVFGNSTIATLVSSEDRGSLIHLNFDYVKTIEAGKAYMIKPGKDRRCDYQECKPRRLEVHLRTHVFPRRI